MILQKVIIILTCTNVFTKSASFVVNKLSFYEYANQRMLEKKSENKELFNKSISSCPFASVDYTNNEVKTNCTRDSFKLANFRINRAERLILIDDFLLGVLSSSDTTIKFYKVDMNNMKVIELNTEKFQNMTPFDACVEENKYLYVAFPLQHTIVKYSFSLNSISFDNVTHIELKEEATVKDETMEPISLACHIRLVYATQKTNNQIRVYDDSLKLLRTINLHGVIISAQRAISVDQNIRVFIDGQDGVGMFIPGVISSKKKVSSVQTSRANVCHFYGNINCIEDVDVYTEEEGSKSSIYMVDSCDMEVKHFHYSKDKNIILAKRFKLESGQPISAVRNTFGYLFVLTNAPVQLHLMDLKNCD